MYSTVKLFPGISYIIICQVPFISPLKVPPVDWQCLFAWQKNSSPWHHLGNFQILQSNFKLKQHYQHFLRCVFKWLAELWESDFSLHLVTSQQSTSAQKPGECLFHELLPCLPHWGQAMNSSTLLTILGGVFMCLNIHLQLRNEHTWDPHSNRQ